MSDAKAKHRKHSLRPISEKRLLYHSSKGAYVTTVFLDDFPSVKKMLCKLIADGLIVAEHREDREEWRLEITEKGKAVLAAMRA